MRSLSTVLDELDRAENGIRMLRKVDLNETCNIWSPPREVFHAFAQAATLLREPAADWQDLRRLASGATIRKILEFDKDSIQDRVIR
mmetsp:Transcript_34036/g.73407  ORF Transcript_34036/g.73407 Transcript_34036/m.73407 type:complete len:87 (-) Transcript_34036:252-512(-)